LYQHIHIPTILESKRRV